MFSGGGEVEIGARVVYNGGRVRSRSFIIVVVFTRLHNRNTRGDLCNS